MAARKATSKPQEAAVAPADVQDAPDTPEAAEAPQEAPEAEVVEDQGNLLHLAGSASTLSAWEASPEGKAFIEAAKANEDKGE